MSAAPMTHVSSLPQCYLFHMYVGVRAGGGIGDEIEDPAGDEYELYRVVFDITFFFFVIVILLAIIQGQQWPRGWLGEAGRRSGSRHRPASSVAGNIGPGIQASLLGTWNKSPC